MNCQIKSTQHRTCTKDSKNYSKASGIQLIKPDSQHDAGAMRVASVTRKEFLIRSNAILRSKNFNNEIGWVRTNTVHVPVTPTQKFTVFIPTPATCLVHNDASTSIVLSTRIDLIQIHIVELSWLLLMRLTFTQHTQCDKINWAHPWETHTHEREGVTGSHYFVEWEKRNNENNAHGNGSLVISDMPH